MKDCGEQPNYFSFVSVQFVVSTAAFVVVSVVASVVLQGCTFGGTSRDTTQGRAGP